MADNPNTLTDKPQAPPIDDSLHGSPLSDYRSGTALQPKDVQQPTTSPGALPDMQLDAHLSHNDKGRLTSVQYADGSTVQCGYGSIGDLNAVTTKDGSRWVKQESTTIGKFPTWELLDKNGRDTGKKADTVMVDDQSGAVAIYTHNDLIPGQQTHYSDIQYANGAKASVDYNANGTKSEKVTFPSGDTETIHYDTQGHTDAIYYGAHNGRLAGCSWQKRGDQWVQYDDSGDTTGATWPKGTWVSTGAFQNGNDISWIHFPDGSAETTLNNGDVVKRDNSSWITQITDVNGKSETFTYGNDGKVQTMTNGDGVVWTSVDGEWKQLDKKGKDTGAPITGFKSVAVAEDGEMKFVSEYL